MATDPYAAFAVQVSGPSPVQQQPRAPRQRQQIRFADDRDAIARTILGEAANQDEVGRLAVASVIANRSRGRGLTPSQVVLERNQFEPWGNPETASRLMSIPTTDPQYQAALALTDRALAGEDPTGGASHFYAPRAQAALGRPAPRWDDGTGVDIGDHRFFRIDDVGAPTVSLVSANAGADPYAAFAVPVEESAGSGDGPIEVEISEGVRNVNGRAILAGEDYGPWDEYWANLRRSDEERAEIRARQEDPEYQRAMLDARAGAEAVPDRLRALGLGGTLGFLTDINAEAQRGFQAAENLGRRIRGEAIEYSSGMAAQAARDAMRDAQAGYAAERPIENFALQAAGGFLAPGLGTSANYINAGRAAGGAAVQSGRMARAAQVGAGYGLAGGIGNAEGNIIERLPEGAQGAAIGAGAGAILQGGADRFLTPRAREGAGSAARRLSREGVMLTPGQMAAEIPVVGPMLRTLEEASSTIPIAGAGIARARDESIETFNRAALNRVLEPIGQRLPTGVRNRAGNEGAGYDAVERAQRLVSQAYDDALRGVEVRPDQQFYDDVGRVVIEASERMPVQMTEQLANVLENRAFRGVEFADSPISGQQFKRTESELGFLAREYRMSNDPANKAFAQAIDGTRTALRDLVARQNPDRAPQIQNVNRAYANLVPIEEAAGSRVAESTEGVFSPTQLSQAASRQQTRSVRGRGEGRMQDLTAPARAILNSRIGDSGTASRGAVTALMSGGAGTAAVLAPGTAIPTVVGVSALYSRPAQQLINAVYRATDGQSAQPALRQLAELARRDPALVPYYEAALQHVLGREPQGTAAAPPAVSAQQQSSPALARVLQQ